MPPNRISELFPWLDYESLLQPPVTLDDDFTPPQLHTEVSSDPPVLTPTQSPSSKLIRAPVNASSTSPLKFNKAVSGFRTPKKTEIEERKGEAQTRASRNIFSENELFYSDEDSIDSAVSEILLKAQEEVKICRIWFNANKMFKVRELSTQTTQYYDDVQIASNNVYSNAYAPPLTPPPPTPKSPEPHDFLDGLNLLEQANILKDITSETSNIPWNILSDDVNMLEEESGNSSDSADILSYVTKNIERTGNFGDEEIFNKILLLDRTDSRQSGAASADSSIPQLDGTMDEDMVRMAQVDGSTDDEQIVVVDDDEDDRVPVSRSLVKQEPVVPAAVGSLRVPPPAASYDSFTSSCGSLPGSSRGPTPARTPVTPMMDLEGDIPGNICTTAMLCSYCGNTFPNKKCHDGHMDLCPALARAGLQTPDSENSPRKDFSISGLLKQEDMKTEAAEERPVEEDIVILSETIKPGPSKMQPPPPRHRPQPQPQAPASYLAPATLASYAQAPAPPTYLSPYGGAMLQYPGTVPGYSPYPYLATPLVQHPGGYITVPHPPVLQQPIYYNNILPAPVSYPGQLPGQAPGSQFSAPPAPVSSVSSLPPLAPASAPLSQASSGQPARKVARVQPTPHIVRPIATKPKVSPAPSVKSQPDPMAALNTLSKNPLPPTSAYAEAQVQFHTDTKQKMPDLSSLTQIHQQSRAKVSRKNVVKAAVPSDWAAHSPKQEVIEVESRSCSPWGDHAYCSSPDPEPAPVSAKVKASLKDVNITTKASKNNSIKFVLQRSEAENGYNIKEVTIKDGSSSKSNISVKAANKALKIKAKQSRVKKFKSDFVVPLNQQGEVYHAENTFVNEQTIGQNTESGVKTGSHEASNSLKNSNDPFIMFKLASEDGAISLEGSNITDLWRKVFEAVSDARSAQRLGPLPGPSLGPSGEDMLGLTHTALRYLLEQVPGASSLSSAGGYKWLHQPPPPQAPPVKENASGSARTEGWSGKRRPWDMFAWLASRDRKKPHPNVGFKLPPELAAEAHLMEGNNRRATSLDLPMAMRYRQLARNAREAVAVYASGIHGRGLFCKREISAGEMVSPRPRHSCFRSSQICRAFMFFVDYKNILFLPGYRVCWREDTLDPD